MVLVHDKCVVSKAILFSEVRLLCPSDKSWVREYC